MSRYPVRDGLLDASRRRTGDDKVSNISSTQLTFGVSSRGSQRERSELSKLSTASKREGAAVQHVHTILSEQTSVLRKVFQEVDRHRDGEASRSVLRAAIIEAIRLHPRWQEGLDVLLDMSDPNATGHIAFGRLMRLVRTPLGAPETDADGTRTSKFAVTADGDEELRQTFAGVNTGDKQLLRRLGTPREMPPMPTCARATNILGDSKVRAPWAVAGDDARMNHILQSIHKERFTDLVAVLKRYCSPTQPGRLTYAQLSRALHEFDQFVHDAEILQYFTAMALDARGVSNEHLQCSDGTIAVSSGTEGSVLPNKLRRETIGINDFVARFGTNVLAAPALRCSATFALKWTLPEPIPVKPLPQSSSPRSARERRELRSAERKQLQQLSTARKPQPAPPASARTAAAAASPLR
jgi:Ca2+-binding EF-hand superfamily protein